MEENVSGAQSNKGLPRYCFQSTRWSLVCQAQSEGNGADREARESLSELCKIYWYPLYAYCRRSGGDAEEAKDFTQGFFEKLIEGNYLAQADRRKGKLRSFLIVAFKRFMSHERRRACALKRGGGIAHLPIDPEWAEDRYSVEPAHELTPERLYERQWAKTLLEGAVGELETRYRSDGKGEIFEALQWAISPVADPASYSSVAEELGMKEAAVKVAAHRLRKRYQEIIRQRIADTLASTDDIDEEISYLLDLF